MKSRFVHRHGGFALIENMIAVLLLSLGAIGIAVSTATTVKINLDNHQRAMALNAATTALEPLYVAAESDTSGTTLRDSLDSFVSSDGYTVSSNPDENDVNRDVFVVKVLQAVDAAGTDVLTATAPYVSPVTVAVQVDYQGIGGKNVPGIEEVKSAKASFTFILQSSSAGS